MRKLIIVIALALSILALAGCGGPSAPTKQVTAQVQSDAKQAGDYYGCVFTIKNVELVGSYVDTKGRTIFVYHVAASFDCSKSTGNASDKGTLDPMYIAVVDKSGKLIEIK